jgi:hypothetical protein
MIFSIVPSTSYVLMWCGARWEIFGGSGWGSVSIDLLQWVPTPKLLSEQFEHFAGGYVALTDFADL